MQSLNIGATQRSHLQVDAPARDTVCVLTALGDFNADGRIDFAVSGMDLGSGASDTSDLRLLLSQSDGSFVDGTSLLGLTKPSYQGASLLSVDLNWDGYSDLVVARSGGDPDTTSGVFGDTQLVYLSNGNGSYQAIESPTEAYAHNGMVADVNGDSRADAFFFATVEGPSILMLNQTQSEVGLSFTFDGLPHQAINAGNGDVWTVLERTPSGSLKTMQGWHQHNTAFNDVDRDGDLDMVMFFGSGSHESLVYLNDGSANPSFDFADPLRVDATIPGIPSAGNYYYGIHNADGSWAGLRSTGQGANYYETTQFDVDGDGWEDIVALASSNNYDYTTLSGQSWFDAADAPGTDRYNHGTFFAVFTNTGGGLRNETGTRIEQPDLKLSYDNFDGHTGYIFNLVSVDLNGDGHLDFLCNNNMNQNLGLLNGLGESSTVFMLNDGHGNFRQASIDGLVGNQFDPIPINGKLGFVATINPTLNDWDLPQHPPRPDWNFYFFETNVPWTIGDSGNDFVYGTVANDQIDGNAGIDTYIALGRREEFGLALSQARVTITDNTGLTGIDSLTNVERVRFYDQTLALDFDGATSAGGIYRLYKATFNREPDAGGLGYWIAQADAGNKDAVRMAEDFTWSQEFQDLYNITTTDNYGTGNNIRALIEGFYENVLGRTPDEGGLNFYTGVIESKDRTVGRVLAEISDSQENYDGTIELIANGIVFDPYLG